MRRFERSTDAEHAYMRRDGDELRAPSSRRFPSGRRALLVWPAVTLVFLAAAAIALFTGIDARDPAETTDEDGHVPNSTPVPCGSVMSPARWSAEKWDENAIRWHTRVCDNARITRLGWTGIFLVGGMAVLTAGAGAHIWQRSRTARAASSADA